MQVIEPFMAKDVVHRLVRIREEIKEIDQHLKRLKLKEDLEESL